MLTPDPVVQELLWRGVAERGMPAPAVVERLDVIEGVGNGLGSRLVAGAMHSLILEAVEETLGRRIVPAVSLAAHRADHPVFLQPRLKGVAGILASPVGVMNQSGCRLPAEPRHGQCIDHDVRRHPRLQGPADDFPVEQIENDGQVEPAFRCPDVGQVGCPDLVRRCRREVPVQPIRRHRQAVLRVRRRLEAPLVPGTDTVLAHEAFDTLLARRQASTPDFLGHSRAAVGALELGVDGPDQRQHLGIGQALAIRRAAALPCPVAAEAHIQRRAHRRQRVGSPLPVNPGVLHSASFAKYAVAFFRISHSILSRAFSAFKRDSSICSGVMTLAPGGFNCPRSAALTQFLRVCSTSPNSRAIGPTPWPDFTRFTASSLNSAVYSCFGILNINSLLFRHPTCSPGRRNFGGSSGFEFHRTGASISDALTKIVESLGVISVRTGEAINITPYRFRRTTGTRAAVEGHGELIIAELLDHTDTQNVGVYVQAVPEIVERIDRAMAFHLAPLAQAFAGTIVSSEEDAIRGGDPSSRVCDPRFDSSMKPMGSCGSHGFCGAMAPVACYTCRSFQPWLDGPHEAVLNYLIAEREHLLAEADLRIASINDRTILAVAEVVARCNQIKSSSTEGSHV